MLRAHFILLSLLLTGALAGEGFAQAGDAPDSAEQRADSPFAADMDGGGATAPDSVTPPTSSDSNSVDMGFDIPGIVALRLKGKGLAIGAAASEAYGWARSGGAESSGAASILQPYMALYDAGQRTKFMLQYSPTIDLYSDQQWDGRILHRGILNFGHLLTQRWAWYFTARATEGPEALGDIENLAIVEPLGYQLFALPTRTLLAVKASTSLTFRRKPRQEFAIRANDYYSEIQQGPRNDAVSVRVQMTNGFGSNSDWFSYVQAHRYLSQDCTRVGMGNGFGVGIGPGLRFVAEGGPEIGVGNCVIRVSATFRGYLFYRFSPTTLFVAGASRELTEPYLMQSRWFDDYSARVQQRVSRSTLFGVGGSYVRSADLEGATYPNFHGFMFFSRLRWRVTSSLSLVGSYQIFDREAAAPGFPDRRSWGIFSFIWHPGDRS